MNKVFNKSIDSTNIYNYLSDNKTIGTAEYYRRKIIGLPEDYYELMEILSRPEYSIDDFNYAKLEYIRRTTEFNKKLLSEIEGTPESIKEYFCNNCLDKIRNLNVLVL